MGNMYLDLPDEKLIELLHGGMDPSTLQKIGITMQYRNRMALCADLDSLRQATLKASRHVGTVMLEEWPKLTSSLDSLAKMVETSTDKVVTTTENLNEASHQLRKVSVRLTLCAVFLTAVLACATVWLALETRWLRLSSAPSHAAEVAPATQRPTP